MPTYIIRAGKTGPVKIGKADDPEWRLRTLQTGHHEAMAQLRERLSLLAKKLRHEESARAALARAERTPLLDRMRKGAS